MNNAVKTPPSAPVLTQALLNRRQLLQWLGVGVVASSCGTLRPRLIPPTAGATPLQLITPDSAGPLPDDVRDVLLDTARGISRFVGFDGQYDEALLEGSLRLKCEERPSYLATYTRFAAEVKRPEQLSVEWLMELPELHRVKVVGELAIMSLIGGGFRTFGFGNMNGHMGGLWHEPHASGSYHASDEL